MVGMVNSKPFHAQRGSRMPPVVKSMQAMRREGTAATGNITPSAA